MKKNLITLGLGVMLSLAVSMVSLAATQTDRWYSENGTWYLRTEDRTGNVTNSWFQDLDGSWYLLAPEGNMYAGLIHDTLTDRYYYCQTVHDGFYGKMAFTDGVYTVNGSQVYLTFNQIHDGTYGAITSGLESLQGAGIETTDIAGIPTESETASTSGAVETKEETVENSLDSTVENSNTSNSDYYDPYQDIIDQMENDQALKDAIRENAKGWSGISLN